MLHKAIADSNANTAMNCFARKQVYMPPDPTVTASGQRIVFTTMSEDIGDVVVSDTPQVLMEGLTRVMRVLERVSCCHNNQKTAIDYVAMEVMDCYTLSFSLRFLLEENASSSFVKSFVSSFVSSFSSFPPHIQMRMLSSFFPDLVAIVESTPSLFFLFEQLLASSCRRSVIAFIFDWLIGKMDVCLLSCLQVVLFQVHQHSSQKGARGNDEVGGRFRSVPMSQALSSRSHLLLVVIVDAHRQPFHLSCSGAEPHSLRRHAAHAGFRPPSHSRGLHHPRLR